MEALTRPQAEQQIDYERRAQNDAETWLAETLEGTMRTPFAYRFDGQELYADDGGALKPIFEDAIVEAERIKHRNPNLAFELRRRNLEQEEYVAMLKMARGELPNTMVVISDFPPELMDATRDVGGYNVERQQTMLRVITWRDGQMVMQSQSLDLSDRRALEAIYSTFGYSPNAGELLGQRMHIDLPPVRQEYLADELTGVYDRSLQSQYGGEWYAGRENEQRRNTYEFVCRQQDLVGVLAYQFVENGYDTPMKYGIAAELANRFNASKYSTEATVAHAPASHEAYQQLMRDINNAATVARAEGKTFSGCGASVGPETKTKDELDESGYGNKTNENSKYNFDKKMFCVVCQAPPKEKEHKKMCGPCGICKGCDTKIRTKPQPV